MPNWLTLLKGNFVIIMKTNIVLLLGNETCKHNQNYTCEQIEYCHLYMDIYAPQYS